MPKKKCKVFVSYSRHDEAVVKPLAELLGTASDDAVFLDVTSIKPGDLWKSEIESALKEASVFVLCWCCESAKSDFVAHEIKLALETGEKRLVPVLFCETTLPPQFAERQWIDLRGRVIHDCTEFHVERPTGIQLPNLGGAAAGAGAAPLGWVVGGPIGALVGTAIRWFHNWEGRDETDDIVARVRFYFERLGQQ